MNMNMTIGEVASAFGVPAWRVRRLFERGLLPAATRVGRYRVVHEMDLPKVEAALVNAGYLQPAEHLIGG